MCCGIGYGVDDSESVGGDGRINEFLSGAAKIEKSGIDDYQKKMDSLESYLEKFRSGDFSPSDKTSLLTEFGIVAGSAEEAAEKVQKRMGKITHSIVADLKEILNGGNISEATRKKVEALIKSLEEGNREAQNFASVKLSGNALADVQSLSEGLDQLDKVYADILDKEDFDFSSVFSADFKKEFGAYTDEYNKFIDTVTSSPDDINACQSTFNDLASAYIYGSKALTEVTEETKDSVIAMLEQQGVANAAAVVEYALAENERMLEAQKYATAQGCDDLTNATYDEINALIKEGIASEDVRLYLAKLALEKWNVNKEELKTKADCDRLLELAKQAGATKDQINRLKNAIANFNTVDFSNPFGTMFDTALGSALGKLAKSNPNIKKTPLYKQFVDKKKKAEKEANGILDEISNSKPDPIIPDYSGGSTTRDTQKKLADEAKKAREDAKKAQEDIEKAQENLNKALETTGEEIDWLDTNLNNLVDSASKAKDEIDGLLTFGAKKKQTQKAIEETTKAIEAQYKAIKKYSAYADTASGKAAEKASLEKAKEIAKAQAELNEAIANAAANMVSNVTSNVVSGAVDTSVGVVNDAMQYVGKLPYIWGGASLTTGADCSGFVQQLYQKYGVSIPHNAQAQFTRILA